MQKRWNNTYRVKNREKLGEQAYLDKDKERKRLELLKLKSKTDAYKKHKKKTRNGKEKRMPPSQPTLPNLLCPRRHDLPSNSMSPRDEQ